MWILRFVGGPLLACAVLVSGAIISDPAHAQSNDELKALNQRVIELYKSGTYAEAIPLAERSLQLTRTQKGEEHLDTASKMGWLAGLYQAQGRYAEAEPLHQRSLAIREKALGPD